MSFYEYNDIQIYQKTSKNTLKIKEFLKKYIKNKMFSPTHVFAISRENVRGLEATIFGDPPRAYKEGKNPSLSHPGIV